MANKGDKDSTKKRVDNAPFLNPSVSPPIEGKMRVDIYDTKNNKMTTMTMDRYKEEQAGRASLQLDLGANQRQQQEGGFALQHDQHHHTPPTHNNKPNAAANANANANANKHHQRLPIQPVVPSTTFILSKLVDDLTLQAPATQGSLPYTKNNKTHKFQIDWTHGLEEMSFSNSDTPKGKTAKNSHQDTNTNNSHS
eukprot:jgi/Psemu1/16485/gm1.16485_g